MTTLLAIDSATDALSLALLKEGQRRCVHRLMPRQQQQLFACLEELLAGDSPASLGLDAIVYGKGPGSFTGLRIAASAAQGLAYSLALPVIGVSTLETQARTLLRRERILEPCLLTSTIDARIGQLYACSYHFDGSGLTALGQATVTTPQALALPETDPALTLLPRFGLGSGWYLAAEFPAAVAEVAAAWPQLFPEAEDMFAPALCVLAAGGAVAADAAVPDYVQRRIGWKKLAEQGRVP